MNINWKTATTRDRAALYLVARAIADAANTSVESIMEQAYGHELVPGNDYLSNFRSGTIGRPKAKLIHAWIAEQHLTAANTVDPNLFPKPHTDAWQEFLDQHAIQGKLSIARFDTSMELVQRKRNQSKPEEMLKLGEEFCFHLNSDIKGYAAAFQNYNGLVYALPLGLRGELDVEVNKGSQLLPLDENGKPDKLTEISDFGQHRFVIAVAEDRNHLPTPQEAPTPNGSVRVHSLLVHIVT